MPRTLLFQLLERDVSAVADLLEQQAPKTCALFWERLPLEGRLVHGMYSGPELFVMLDGFGHVPGENQVHLPAAGEIGYFCHEAGVYAASPRAVAELVLAYDRGVAIKGPDGVDSYVNLFARLRLEQAAEFLAAIRSVRREGPLVLRLARGAEA